MLELEIDSGSTNLERIIKPGIGRSAAIRKVISLIIVGVCVLVSGCQRVGVRTIWTAEARSPDGLWLASARTDQHGGFASSGVETIVYLKRTNDSRPPVQVLGFIHDPNFKAGTINLTMKWATPSHLDVTYNGPASLDFQVVKCAGIDISVRELSGGMIKHSQ
jgi:hypothetical protein